MNTHDQPKGLKLKRLQSLILGTGLKYRSGPVDSGVSDITDDSRRVTGGSLFVSRGVSADTASYIAQAIELGAAAVVSEPIGLPQLPDSIVHYEAGTVDQRLAGILAERFFDSPAKQLALIGVTGTNGKTTIAILIQHLLQATGIRTGVIGTIYSDDGTAAGRRTAQLTTPGAIELSRDLARMVQAGCKSVAIEVSSHALEQGRASELSFRAAVFTNLTQDHMDYHRSMQAYAKAKSLLFAQLADGGLAVVNRDDSYAQDVLAGYSGRVLWTSLTDAEVGTSDAVCHASGIELRADSSDARLVGPWGDFRVTLPLVGRHNVCNILQAVAVAHEISGSTDTLKQALETTPQVPGRLERVKPSSVVNGSSASAQAQPPAVLVDYAHTPDALENASSALRSLTPGRLIVMFGCGGDRDRAKRPMMAQAACRYADRIYLTSDNPRTEDPETIIKDALVGVPENRKPDLVVLSDRAEAIRASVLEGVAGDTVLLAGKGHEDYQTIGHDNIHFDDREHALQALVEWSNQKAVK